MVVHDPAQIEISPINKGGRIIKMLGANPDKRKFDRFEAKSGTIVAIRPIPELLGELIDIGFGGLSFKYIQSEITPQESAELIILLPNRTFFLDRIPCRPVSDIQLHSDNSFSSLPMRRCSLAFGPLETFQLAQLEHFIRHHTLPAQGSQPIEATFRSSFGSAFSL